MNHESSLPSSGERIANRFQNNLKKNKCHILTYIYITTNFGTIFVQREDEHSLNKRYNLSCIVCGKLILIFIFFKKKSLVIS